MWTPAWDNWPKPNDNWGDTEGAAWSGEGAANWQENMNWEGSSDARGSSWQQGSCWEQSGPHMWGHKEEAEHNQQPWSGRGRQPGNGNRPKANDPAGWQHGENKPTDDEYKAILEFPGYGPANKDTRLQFKAYEHQERKRMQAEDTLSKLERAGQKEKDAKDAALAHEEVLQRVLQEGRVLLEEALLDNAAEKAANELFRVNHAAIYKERVVYVEVLPEGAEKPKPLFRGGQGVHQWWAHWMAGAFEVPSGVKQKSRGSWYSASVLSWEQFCLQACRDAGLPGVALRGE